jgi:hypothetical protein
VKVVKVVQVARAGDEAGKEAETSGEGNAEGR